jgi:hypothetical protein
MIGYKAFNSNLMCYGFQYEIGKTYEFDGEIKLCDAGFHFCENIADCFTYYPYGSARFAKVEALGKVIKSDRDSKCVTDKIRIIEEISIDDAIKMSNSGNYNTGSGNAGNHNSGNGNIGGRNTGDWNSGDDNTGNYNAGDQNTGGWNAGDDNTGNCNAGDQNTGDWNSGDFNSGDWNSGDFNSGNGNIGNCNSGDWNKSSSNNGCFMTDDPKIMMFNKPSNWTIDDWYDSRAYSIMQYCFAAKYTDVNWIRSS